VTGLQAHYVAFEARNGRLCNPEGDLLVVLVVAAARKIEVTVQKKCSGGTDELKR
jgi:hypothetical protein